MRWVEVAVQIGALACLFWMGRMFANLCRRVNRIEVALNTILYVHRTTEMHQRRMAKLLKTIKLSCESLELYGRISTK